MSSKVPTVRQIAWISIIPQILIMGIIILIWYLFNSEKALLYGAGTYLLLSFSLRSFVPKDHRNGIKKIITKNSERLLEILKKVTLFSKNMSGLINIDMQHYFPRQKCVIEKWL